MITVIMMMVVVKMVITIIHNNDDRFIFRITIIKLFAAVSLKSW